MKLASDRIRKIRAGMGFSQEYIAKKMHISQQSYSLIERNPEGTTLKKLKKVAQILNVSIMSLIGEDEALVQKNLYQNAENGTTNIMDSETLSYINYIKHLNEEIIYLRDENKKLMELVR